MEVPSEEVVQSPIVRFVVAEKPVGSPSHVHYMHSVQNGTWEWVFQCSQCIEYSCVTNVSAVNSYQTCAWFACVHVWAIEYSNGMLGTQEKTFSESWVIPGINFWLILAGSSSGCS